MALMKATLYVESGGKITIPRNILMKARIGEKDFVEITIIGTDKHNSLVITKKKDTKREMKWRQKGNTYTG